MHRSLRLVFAGAACLLPLAVSCENQLRLAPLRDGAAACEELRNYCAEPAAALGEPYQGCYDTGLKGYGNGCLSIYYDCMPDCRNALASLGGAGGEGGGAAADAGGAGGESPAASAGGAAGASETAGGGTGGE